VSSSLASLYPAPESLRGFRIFLRSTNDILPHPGLGSAVLGQVLNQEVEVGEPPKLPGISVITGSESYVSVSLRSIG